MVYVALRNYKSAANSLVGFMLGARIINEYFLACARPAIYIRRDDAPLFLPHASEG